MATFSVEEQRVVLVGLALLLGVSAAQLFSHTGSTPRRDAAARAETSEKKPPPAAATGRGVDY